MKLSPSVFAAVIGTLSLMPIGASASNFASYVVSSSGLSTNSLYNDPTAALGQPTTLDNDYDTDVYHACMVNPAFGKDANTGQNLWVNFQPGTVSAPATGQLTVQLTAPITHTGNSWYGQDFIVYSNQGFNGASPEDFVGDGTDMSSYQIADGSTFGTLPQVSVSKDGITFYAVSPSSSVAYPENPYHWDGLAAAPNTAGWGALNDFSKPVNPALTAADFANQTVEDADNTLYNGSAGGTPYTFAQTGLTAIDYIRFSANPTGPSGVVDGVAAVGAAAPEPAQASALILMGLGLSGLLWQARRRTGRA